MPCHIMPEPFTLRYPLTIQILPVPPVPSTVDNNKGEVIKNRAATGPEFALVPVARRSRLKPAWTSCIDDRRRSYA